MKTAIVTLIRLAWRTYFPGNDPLARRTWKRLCVMSLFLPVFCAVQLVHWCALLLDEVLFPSYRRVDVKRPLFLVGVPRSGTTFLHRLIAEDKSRFTTFVLWELLLAPAITEKLFWIGIERLDRSMGQPFFRLWKFFESRVLGWLDSVHKTSLLDPEEDFLALLPIFGCFLLVLPFPQRGEMWRLGYFDTWPAPERRRLMEFYKRIVQRHLFVRGPDKQLLSKNPSFSAMVQSLRQTFPDCCIVCNLRNPYEAIPSLLSTMMDGAELFGNDVSGKEYQDELVTLVKHFYRHLTDSLSPLPASEHTFVRFDDLTENPQGVVQTLYERLQYDISVGYSASLQLQHDRAKGYQSRHHYSLEQFGLSPQSIRSDLSRVFERFDFQSDYVGTGEKPGQSSRVCTSDGIHSE